MNLDLIDETSFGSAANLFIRDFKSQDNIEKGIQKCFSKLKIVESFDQFTAKCKNCGDTHLAQNLLLCSECYSIKCKNCSALKVVQADICDNHKNHPLHIYSKPDKRA